MNPRRSSDVPACGRKEKSPTGVGDDEATIQTSTTQRYQGPSRANQGGHVLRPLLPRANGTRQEGPTTHIRMAMSATMMISPTMPPGIHSFMVTSFKGSCASTGVATSGNRTEDQGDLPAHRGIGVSSTPSVRPSPPL